MGEIHPQVGIWVFQQVNCVHSKFSGQESNYRFWPIWLVTWAGIILVLMQALNLFV